jgi:arsenate reductase
MAEGFLKGFNDRLEIYSAGTHPAAEVHPKAVLVMKEEGIDLTNYYPKPVDDFLDQEFEFVITVCGGAKESCPAFSGEVRNRLHIGFEDPADAIGTNEEIETKFRKIRDEIKRDFFKFYEKELK